MSNLGFQGFQIHSELNKFWWTSCWRPKNCVMECFESCLYISNKTALVNIEWKKNKFLHISGNSMEKLVCYGSYSNRGRISLVQFFCVTQWKLVSPNCAPDFKGIAAWWSGKERKYVTRCMSILKVTTRNGQIKSRKNLVNSLSKRKKNQERIQAPTYVAQVLDPFQFFDNGLTNNEELPPARKKGKKKSRQRDPSPIYCKFITPN